jgi:hypothetical protein
MGVWYGGPWIGSIVGGVGGFLVTLAVQAWLWLRNMLVANDEPRA